MSEGLGLAVSAQLQPEKECGKECPWPIRCVPVGDGHVAFEYDLAVDSQFDREAPGLGSAPGECQPVWSAQDFDLLLVRADEFEDSSGLEFGYFIDVHVDTRGKERLAR